jgi:3',5'-cyclic-nucleotide phosphodiesterase
LIDDRMAVDAGAITSQLELGEQEKLEVVLCSHSHLDHIRDLATVADNRAQLGSKPLIIAATKATIDVLKSDFFNDKIWPDFTKIPAADEPTIIYQEIPLEVPTKVLDYVVTAVSVNHTVDAAGCLIDDGKGTIGFSGDTGPTDRFWEFINRVDDLKALLMEVSFPNSQQALATASGHHTPQTLIKDLQKLSSPESVATMLYHIKPPFQAEVEKECAKLEGVNLHVLQLMEHFIL